MPHQPNSVQPSFHPANLAGSQQAPLQRGMVFLVGAGPGDPGLLTLRGLECLRLSDVVLYDGLASEQILDYALGAECISVGKHGQISIWSQGDINERMLELARSGKRVVRLKGGDPAVFARTAEELEFLASHAIPFEVVPGITAALAAASYVGIPITHRRFASAVAFVTGQQNADEPQTIDWEALARFPGTLVFYMGVTTAQEWTSRLMASGKPGDTPAAIVRRCTWPDQTVVRCALKEVADYLTPASRMRPPVIVIVGSVAELGEGFNWFASRPLHGCGVLVTRAAGQHESLVEPLRERGAEVFHQPVFSVQPPDDFTAIDRAIDELQRGVVAGVTFSSGNGVSGFMQRVAERQLDSRIFAGTTLAAVGFATGQQLQSHGLRCDILPPAGESQSAAGLLRGLSQHVSAGDKWWVTTTNRSRPTLAEGLQELGAEVEECLAYETQPVTQLRPTIQSALAAGRLHYVTITSGFVAEAAIALLDQARGQLHPIALGAEVAARLVALGWPPVAVATEHTTEALVAALETHWRS